MNDKEINLVIGQNIRKWRKMRGLTGETVGMILGCTSENSAKVLMSRIETGKGAIVIDKVVPIATALQIPIEWLFDGVPGYEGVNSEALPSAESLLNKDEAELFRLFRELNIEGKAKALTYLKDLSATGLYDQVNNSREEDPNGKDSMED